VAEGSPAIHDEGMVALRLVCGHPFAFAGTPEAGGLLTLDMDGGGRVEFRIGPDVFREVFGPRQARAFFVDGTKIVRATS
jgi:hypothetical protein